MKHLITLLLIVGCGTEPKHSDIPRATQERTEAPKPASVTETKAPVDDTVNDDGDVLYVAGNTAPSCDTPHNGRLIYMATERSFKVCNGTSWDAIDLRGQSGTDGKSIQGSKGDKGEATPTNQWFDPITKRWWLFGPAQAYNASVCNGTYTMPSPSDLQTAYSHGLFIAAANQGAPDTAWTNEVEPTSPNTNSVFWGKHYYVRADGIKSIGNTDPEVNRGLFCVSNNTY